MLVTTTNAFTEDDLLAGDGTAIIIHADSDNFANIPPERYQQVAGGAAGPDDMTLPPAMPVSGWPAVSSAPLTHSQFGGSSDASTSGSARPTLGVGGIRSRRRRNRDLSNPRGRCHRASQ